MEQNILATACGRVQGVGFRYFVQRQATALGICGWVKNCEDGSVRMLLQGERAAVEKLLVFGRVFACAFAESLREIYFSFGQCRYTNCPEIVI